jgi:hypothetical protein
MPVPPPTEFRRSGAYIIKAAESRPRPVEPKSNGRRPPVPSPADKALAAALLASRRP